MERIAPAQIAEALLSAPGWARLGLTERSEHIRRQAALELALAVIEEMDGETGAADPNQLVLFS